MSEPRSNSNLIINVVHKSQCHHNHHHEKQDRPFSRQDTFHPHHKSHLSNTTLSMITIQQDQTDRPFSWQDSRRDRFPKPAPPPPPPPSTTPPSSHSSLHLQLTFYFINAISFISGNLVPYVSEQSQSDSDLTDENVPTQY